MYIKIKIENWSDDGIITTVETSEEHESYEAALLTFESVMKAAGLEPKVVAEAPEYFKDLTKEIAVGSRVMLINNWCDTINGRVGFVRELTSYDALVEIPGWTGGHHGVGGPESEGPMWYVPLDDLTLIA